MINEINRIWRVLKVFSFGKKNRVMDYLEKEILRISLGCQNLLKKWLTVDYREQGDILPEKLNEELKKYYAAVTSAITVEVRRDYSDAAADKLSKLVAEFQKDHMVTGDFLYEFSYSAILNQMPTKKVVDKGKSIAETQLKLCKVTTAEVLEGR